MTLPAVDPSRLLRPRRVGVDVLRAAADEGGDDVEVWERLAARGRIPASWTTSERRAFSEWCHACKGLGFAYDNHQPRPCPACNGATQLTSPQPPAVHAWCVVTAARGARVTSRSLGRWRRPVISLRAMGLFDFRCPISGLSLRAADAAHVALIELEPDQWTPLTLPLVGSYDRAGSVDGLAPTLRTEILVGSVGRVAQTGRFDAPGAPGEFSAFARAPSIERLLHLFERVNTMSEWAPMPFTLDGCQLRQVLIHAEVFAALAPPTIPSAAPSYEALEEQLARAPLARQGREFIEEIIIAPDEARVEAGAALAQLTAFTRWLDANGRRWSPLAQSGQFCAPDDLRFAREARAGLHSVPALRPVIDRTIARFEQECALRQ